jgi:mRNA-degrading endonuclease RelE of RelBE toxin-antitoxin system
MPARDRERINEVLNQMKGQPLSGDLAPLRAEYQGAFRRRIGSWRIVFTVRPDGRTVIVHDIMRRTSTTY